MALLLHVKETDVRLNIHMANKKQKLNKTERERGGKDREGGHEKPSSLPSETVDLCDQAAREAGGKEQEKKVFFTHFFTWLHITQKPSLGADIWMLISLTEASINIPHDPLGSMWRPAL